MSDAQRDVWQQVGTNEQKWQPSRALLLWFSLALILWSLIIGGIYALL